MIRFKNLTWLLTILVTLLFITSPLKSQVVIGEDKDPYSFSLLELISDPSNTGGLRLPQLNETERETLKNQLLQFQTNNPGDISAEGLVIFNTYTGCVEFWNGSTWISLCAGISKCIAPVITGIINGATSVFAGETDLYYSVTKLPDVTYGWTLPALWTKTGGGDSNIIKVKTSANGGDIGVIPIKDCNGTEKILSGITIYTLGCCKTPPKITINTTGAI